MSQSDKQVTQNRQSSGRSTGFLSFILGRFLRIQRTPSKGATAGGSEEVLQPAVRVEIDQSVPAGCTGPPIHDCAAVLPVPEQSKYQRTVAEPDCSSDWDFSRRSGRSGRSQRSAREWARDSDVISQDISQTENSQNSDARSLALLADNADSLRSQPVLKQKRPGQPEEKSSEQTLRRYLTRRQVVLEKTGDDGTNCQLPEDGVPQKRKSIEAGLDIDSTSRDKSSERVVRRSTEQGSQLSDFYPTELQERNHIFNAH